MSYKKESAVGVEITADINCAAKIITPCIRYEVALVRLATLLATFFRGWHEKSY